MVPDAAHLNLPLFWNCFKQTCKRRGAEPPATCCSASDGKWSPHRLGAVRQTLRQHPGTLRRWISHARLGARSPAVLGAEAVDALPLPLGMLSEEAQEARNKDVLPPSPREEGLASSHHADQLGYLLVTSGP